MRVLSRSGRPGRCPPRCACVRRSDSERELPRVAADLQGDRRLAERCRGGCDGSLRAEWSSRRPAGSGRCLDRGIISIPRRPHRRALLPRFAPPIYRLEEWRSDHTRGNAAGARNQFPQRGNVGPPDTAVMRKLFASREDILRRCLRGVAGSPCQRRLSRLNSAGARRIAAERTVRRDETPGPWRHVFQRSGI
jgi:hypothetical protein